METQKTDKEILTRLCELINKRKRGVCRSRIAKLYRTHGTIIRRERRAVAHRYLRRFSTGTWLKCGSHVSRPDFGPMICFPDRHDAYIERCGKKEEPAPSVKVTLPKAPKLPTPAESHAAVHFYDRHPA